MRTKKSNWIIWFVGLPLVVTGSVALGIILGNTTKKTTDITAGTQQPLSELPEKIEPQAGDVTQAISPPQTSIIGKWRYWGTEEFGQTTVQNVTIEYFEDGIYYEINDDKILGYRTQKGDYRAHLVSFIM